MFTNNLNLLNPKKRLKYQYSQLILYGFSYSFRRLRARRMLLNLQYSYNIKLRAPSHIMGRIFKRRYVIFGQNIQMGQFMREFSQIRSPNIYTGKGVRLRTVPFRLKPGKINKR